MTIICLETMQQIFEFFDAAEAKARFARMGLSPKAEAQVNQFIERYAQQGYMALKKRSDEYLDPINNLVTQFYNVATPGHTPWIMFRTPEGSPLHRKWFYFNHGRSLFPMANPIFERVTVTGMVRPLVYAWENSDNQELLDRPDGEKVDKWPYYRIYEGDHLLILDMNAARILEDAPVYTCTLRQLKEVPGHSDRKELYLRQLTKVFDSYAEMLSCIEKIQFCSLQYNHMNRWEIPFQEQQKMSREPGFDRTQRFFTIG